MFYIKIVDHTFLIKNRYSYVEKLCRDYLIPPCEPDFVIEASVEEIQAEETGENQRLDLAESAALLRKLSETLMPHQLFLMHGVVLETNGTGVLFVARSGVGKSTHAAFWKQLPGIGARIINGDKPFFRVDGGTLIAYGTPWAGKEHEQVNTSCPVRKICFLERGEENECTRLAGNDPVFRILPFVYAKNGTFAAEVLNLITVTKPEFYLLRCRPELAAAECAYRAMFGSSDQ